MNDTFNFSRFGKYYVSDLKNMFNNNWLTVLLTALSGLIAYMFFGIIHLLFDGSWDSYGLAGRCITFLLLLYVLIIIIPSKAYGFFTEKRSGGFYTLIPASPLEKFLAMLLNTTILVPLAYLVIAFSVDGLLCLFDPHCGSTLVKTISGAAQAINEFSRESGVRLFSNGELFLGVAVNIISCAITFLLGALYFKKNKIGKTILALILFCMAMSLLTPFINPGEGFFDWLSEMEDPQRVFDTMKAVWYVLGILITAGLGVWAYFRVKTVKH